MACSGCRLSRVCGWKDFEPAEMRVSAVLADGLPSRFRATCRLAPLHNVRRLLSPYTRELVPQNAAEIHPGTTGDRLCKSAASPPPRSPAEPSRFSLSADERTTGQDCRSRPARRLAERKDAALDRTQGRADRQARPSRFERHRGRVVCLAEMGQCGLGSMRFLLCGESHHESYAHRCRRWRQRQRF